MKIMKKIIMLTFLLLVMSFSVTASPIWDDVVLTELEGDILQSKAANPSFLYPTIGNFNADLDVQFTANETASNLKINASIVNTTSLVSTTLDVVNATLYKRSFSLPLPGDVDNYTLKIEFSENDEIFLTEEYAIEIKESLYCLDIHNVSITPSNNIKTGDTFSADFNVQNCGTEQIILVEGSFSIDSLNLSSDFAISSASFLPGNNESMHLDFTVPSDAQSGTHNYEIKADVYNQEDTYTDTIAVYPPQAPTITSTPANSVRVNKSYSYDVEATDINLDTITYSLSQSPAGMTINDTTGLISWMPDTTGIFAVIVTATDVDGSTNQSFNIEVLPPLMLEIYDLDVKVDKKTDKNLKDGDRISKEPAPGSKVTFDIQIKNLFEDDIDIEDVEVNIEIKDIDDGDDLDESKTIGKIRADKKSSATMDFTVPYMADEGDYDVIITLEGVDENDVEHSLTWNLVLEVDKEKHHVIFEKFTVSPATLSCLRTLQVGVDVQNIGSNDEDVSIRIESEELSINNLLEDFTLIEDTEDEESKLSHIFSFDIGDIKPGTYPIKVTLTYDDDEKVEEKTSEITVTDCILSRSASEDVNNDNDADDSDVQILQSTQNAEPLDNSEEESPFLMAGLISAVIVALGLVIYLGMFVVMKIL